MTDKQDLIREIHEYVTTHGGENTATHLLVQAASAIQTQAAELEAVGASGVSGPLVGQPQAMPDLSQLTECGAKAWAGVDAQGLREGFTAADMATAESRGFRDGVASIAANAGEPAAYLIDWPDEPELGHYFSESPTETGRCRPRYLAAPPTAPAVAAPDPVAYLYDDGSWTPAKTEEGRKLSNWMISAGSPKIGVLLASAAQPTRAVQATQTGNQREARPCHVFTVRKAGSLTEWAPTSMAFALPDGAHALYTLPAPPTSAEGAEHG